MGLVEKLLDWKLFVFNAALQMNNFLSNDRTQQLTEEAF